MSCELTIVTVVDGNSSQVLKLQGKWSQDAVQLLLNDGTTSWIGDFNLVDMDVEILSQLDLSSEQYWERMKDALGSASLDYKFRYTFNEDALSWAKVVTPDYSVLHGSIPLSRVAPSSHGQLIRSLLDSYSSVLQELSQSVARYHSLEKEYQEINSALEDCARIKNEMESTLYTKFALILNEKKEYVRRVTGEYPDENFGPQLSSEPKSHERPNSTSIVSLKDLSKIVKRDHSASGGRPSKRPMLEPKPTTSRIFDEDMDL